MVFYPFSAEPSASLSDTYIRIGYDTEISVDADAPLECLCLDDWVWIRAGDFRIECIDTIGLDDRQCLKLLEAERKVSLLYLRKCIGQRENNL